MSAKKSTSRGPMKRGTGARSKAGRRPPKKKTSVSSQLKTCRAKNKRIVRRLKTKTGPNKTVKRASAAKSTRAKSTRSGKRSPKQIAAFNKMRAAQGSLQLGGSSSAPAKAKGKKAARGRGVPSKGSVSVAAHQRGVNAAVKTAVAKVGAEAKKDLKAVTSTAEKAIKETMSTAKKTAPKASPAKTARGPMKRGTKKRATHKTRTGRRRRALPRKGNPIKASAFKNRSRGRKGRGIRKSRSRKVARNMSNTVLLREAPTASGAAVTHLALRPVATPLQVERAAEVTLSRKDRFGSALRRGASRRALKLGVFTGIGLGIVDSFAPAASLEAKSVAKTGVGYKAWLGGLALITSAVATMVGEEPTASAKKFKTAELVSDLALNIADTSLTIEGYNVAVTRGARVISAGKALINKLNGAPAALPEATSATGLRGGRGGASRPFAGSGRFIKEQIDHLDPDSIQKIAEIFGLGDDAQDALFGSFEEAPEGDPEGLPIG